MSGLAFDALLPDFAVADRETVPHRTAFVPIIAGSEPASGQFETLAPGEAGSADANAIARNAARDAYAQQDQPKPDEAAADQEAELDRQWEAAERSHEAQAGAAEELTEKHEAELNSLRAVHAAEVASLTVHAIEDMETRIGQAIQGHLVSILGAVLSSQHQKRTVAQFAEKISDMVRDGRGVQIRVSGPQQLLDALRAELGDGAKRYLLVPAETTELEAVIDESILSTRFGEWHSALERVLA